MRDTNSTHDELVTVEDVVQTMESLQAKGLIKFHISGYDENGEAKYEVEFSEAGLIAAAEYEATLVKNHH